MYCLYICKSRHLHYSIVWNYFFFHTEKPRSSYRYMYLDWISAYYSKFLEAGLISDWFWSCLYNLKKEHQLTICKVWYELVWLHYEKKYQQNRLKIDCSTNKKQKIPFFLPLGFFCQWWWPSWISNHNTI